MDSLFSSIFLNIRNYSHCISLCCCAVVVGVLFSAATPSFANTLDIAPERDIAVVPDAPQSPDWKVLWDGARNLTRDGNLDLAADAYAQLFSIKPNIEEANWEYCKILLEIQSFGIAQKIIALLLEENPGKSEYLLAAGRIAAQQKKFVDAERYFGLIFEKDPAGKYSDSALSGLAYSLRARGLKGLAFPLMQQLTTRQPENKTFIHDLALDAVSLKRYDLARRLYRDLLDSDNVDDRIIFQAASVFDEAGLEKERDSIYERYLSLHPDYLPFRMKLMETSELRGDYELLMLHLTHLIDNDAVKDELLLKAAKVSEQHLKRPDKALQYLEQYYNAHPESVDVAEAIVNLQESMARDFLSIVENGGADLLWKDLESIGRSRLAIFARMGQLLEAEKKTVALIDILEIQHKNGSSSSDLQFKLAQLWYHQHNYQKTLSFLEDFTKLKRDYNFYTLQSKAELKLGREVAGLNSLIQCIELKPDVTSMRREAIELAGKLGWVSKQQELFGYVADEDFVNVSNSLLKTHIEMLTLNKLYGKALDLCERSIAAHIGKLSSLDFYLLKSEILRNSGEKRKAEQLLRQLLPQKKFSASSLLQLTRNSIHDHDLGAARKWFRQLDKIEIDDYSSKDRLAVKNSVQLVEIRLLLVEGNSDLAQLKIDNSLAQLKGKQHGPLENTLYRDLIKEQYRLYLITGDVVAGDSLLGKEEIGLELDAELLAQRVNFSNSAKEGDNTQWFRSYLDDRGNIIPSKWLELIEKDLISQNTLLAERHLKELPPLPEQSIRLKNIRNDIAVANGEYDGALDLLNDLGNEFPAESYYCKKKLEVLAKSGDYALALDSFKTCYPSFSAAEPRFDQEFSLGIENGVFYARLLWGNKRYEDALAIYQEILDPPVYQQLINQFKDQNIDYQYLNREQTFWSSMQLILESDPEIIAELMEPDFLVDNRGTVTGKIVSDNFEVYSWQKLIGDEFLARKAIFNKNYHFAAKSYEKLLQYEKSTENKVDLATIYSRIGEYRKEAQVYEDLTNSGDVTPELQDLITRNILKIRPTNTIDAELEEREGREGVVNIRKTSLGTTFWFTPDLTKDFWFKYAYNRYQTTDRNDNTGSNLLYGSMSYEFAEDYELIAGIGTEKFTDTSNSETQYNIELKGQLDDFISGFVHFQKEPVDDSVASLKDNIYRRFLQTGLSVETELGVTFGGDLEYSIYSDENERNRFYLYSSYSIFGDSLQFDMLYSYQYLANKDINGPDGVFSEDVNNDFVKSYWSPDSFSEHRLGLQVKKDFFGYLTDFENKMSYALFDAGISLEDEENVAFSARFNIFLEMSPHLLLKGNFSFNSSDVYDEKLLSLSLHYSW